MLSVLLCIGLLCFYSSFIWDIHFEGNEKWTNETLLEFLESKNVSAHMPKSKVDCAQIVKDIRAEYDDIVWVSASIDGSRLRIQIKENEDEFLDSEEVEETPMDLIATKDGVITEIITRSGVPQVHIGDVVTQGQLLVSGRIDVKNDSAEVVDYQYQVSDADIYADTQMEYEYTISTTYQEKVYGHRQQKIQYYLQIGSLEFAIGNLDHTFEESEESSVMHQIKLGENFYLPIYYGYRQIKSYTSQEKTYTRREIQEILTKEFQLFLNELEEKGIQIKENNVRIELSDSSATAKGTIYLNERITTQTQTEVIQVERTDTNESDGTND
jgi:similar to stage IV sporulation protein